MKNRFEVRERITAIFVQRKDGTVLEVLIDTVDLPKVQAINGFFHARWQPRFKRFDIWGVTKSEYGCTAEIALHRMLAGNTTRGINTQFLDDNPLNCRRNNLLNVPINKKPRDVILANIPMVKTTGLKGVSYHKPSGRWSATVFLNGKRHCLGYRREELDAAQLVIDFRNEHGIVVSGKKNPLVEELTKNRRAEPNGRKAKNRTGKSELEEGGNSKNYCGNPNDGGGGTAGRSG